MLLFGSSMTETAQAQYNPWYERGRDRDYRRERRDERRYRNDDSRYLRDSVERIDRLSGQLKDDLDSALDRSRYNGRKREDRINELAHDFHEAAAKFKDLFDNGQDMNRAAGEARRTLELGFRLDQFIRRNSPGRRVESKWAQISSDLRRVADAYSY